MKRLISQIGEFAILGVAAFMIGSSAVHVTSSPLTAGMCLTAAALTFYAVGRWWWRP